MQQLPSIPEAVRLIAAGELTPLQIVDFCLARIEAAEPEIQAWVTVDAEGARREAERLGRLDQPAGPLHGMPLGVKDIIDAEGFATRAGSPLMSDDPIDADAPVVRRLRAAGAIILGKTVTTEFACFDPPPTRNPWNTNCTPGGSSSGSAAAVARQMCMAAVGSQTGGSITRPASFCGVAGMKPGFSIPGLRSMAVAAWTKGFTPASMVPSSRSWERAVAMIVMFSVQRSQWTENGLP